MIAHFNQYYVYTGEFDRGIYKILEHAEAFVKTIETYILRKEEEKRRQEPKERLRQNRKQSLNSGKEERMF